MISFVDQVTAAHCEGLVQINLVLASMTMDVIGGLLLGKPVLS